MSEMRAANGAGPDGDPRKADRGEDLADLLASIEDRLDPDRPRAALAHAPAEPPAAAERSVVFLLGATRCAVPIDRVLEIGDVPAITPVPNVPAWVRGVANLRGDILAIVDLGAYVGLPPRGRAAGAGRLLVVRAAPGLEGEVAAGLQVDAVEGVVAVPRGELAPPVPSIDGRLAALLAGVVTREGRPLAAFDLDLLFNAPEIRRLSAPTGS